MNRGSVVVRWSGSDSVATTTSVRQKTIKTAISCSGVGLHSGSNVNMTLRPAPSGTGIIFTRVDVENACLAAVYDSVSDTKLGTTLSNVDGVSLGTVEHLMAALWGCEIDNLFIDIDGPEVPVMDGSSAPFVFLIECAGIVEQDVSRQAIRVCRPIEVIDGGKRITLRPATTFSVDFMIDFEHPMISCQTSCFGGEPSTFKAEISRSRTFGFAKDVEALHAAGFARGGSLENAVVIGEDCILNEGGLRYEDEFVRHKVLDCVGDLYLAGAPLLCHVDAHCSGHQLNNGVLRALFSSDENWELEPINDSRSDWIEVPAAAEA